MRMIFLIKSHFIESYLKLDCTEADQYKSYHVLNNDKVHGVLHCRDIIFKIKFINERLYCACMFLPRHQDQYAIVISLGHSV